MNNKTSSSVSAAHDTHLVMRAPADLKPWLNTMFPLRGRTWWAPVGADFLEIEKKFLTKHGVRRNMKVPSIVLLSEERSSLRSPGTASLQKNQQ